MTSKVIKLIENKSIFLKNINFILIEFYTFFDLPKGMFHFIIFSAFLLQVMLTRLLKARI